MGKAVDPPLRVREDWWVFERLLRFKGVLVVFRSFKKLLLFFSNVKEVLIGFQKILMPRRLSKAFFKPYFLKK